MKQLIKDVLEDIAESQPNLYSESARENIATVIISAIRASDKGWYLDLDHSEEREKKDKKILESHMIGEQKARESWVCEICGKSTYEVEYDYIGTGTNHLGCELEDEKRKGDRREKNWSQKKHEDKVFIAQAEEIDGMYFDDEVKEWEEAVGYKEEVKKTDTLIDKSVEDFERNKLSEEIVDDKDAGYIYESSDGGKTVYRRELGSDKKTKIKIEVQD